MASTSNQKDTAALVTKLAVEIIDQGDIATVSEVPSLPKHQADAKAQSTAWVETTWPLIIKTTADIIDYNNTFQAIYSTLQSLLPKVGQGDSTAKTEFTATLQKVLIPALEEKAKASKDIVEKIRTFFNEFQVLYQNFNLDFAETNKLLQLPAEVLSRMNIQIAQLKEMESQISHLLKNTEQIAKAADSTSNGWLSLTDQLNHTITGLKQISPTEPEIIEKIELEATNKRWQDVFHQVTLLQPANTS